jgi:AcrR family transcriptional regulator
MMDAKRDPDAGMVAPEDQTARQRLIEAALRLFDGQGYAATSVSQIVEAAGVTKPVLYYHFGSKEGIFKELLRQGSEKMAEILGRHRDPAPKKSAAAIRRLFAEAHALLIENIPVVRLVHSIHYGATEGAPDIDCHGAHTSFHETLKELVSAGIRSGEFRHVDPNDAAMALAGLLGEVIMNTVHGCFRVTGRVNLEGMLEIVLAGLSAGANRGGDT